jgi:hypothetical protein
MNQQLIPHCGAYRIRLTPAHFGQIIRRGREWHAEVRYVDTGVLKRYAGIWGTRRDAVEELLHIGGQL